MSKDSDLYYSAAHGVFYYSATATDGTEGTVLDWTSYSGTALAVLRVIEDASIVNTKKLDVTIHNVADDSEAPVDANKIATFTQIVGENDGAVVIKTPQFLPIKLDRLPLLTAAQKAATAEVRKGGLQIILENTSAWAGVIDCYILFPGSKSLPVRALP